MANESVTPGIYNIDYYSGAQVGIYIGDIWVDEVTSMSYSVSQTRRPLFGYASQLFDDVSEGVILIQGQFTINFKEAGYLWLTLDRYQSLMNGKPDILSCRSENRSPDFASPFASTFKDEVNRQSVEEVINGEVNTFTRNRMLQQLAALDRLGAVDDAMQSTLRRQSSASLGGYASDSRRAAEKSDSNVGSAEGIFEGFENRIWKAQGDVLDAEDRRCDDPDLNPFDIYMVYGDFLGTDYDNHTIRRLRDVYITGEAQQVVIDGQPLQELYTFMARNIV